MPEIIPLGWFHIAGWRPCSDVNRRSGSENVLPGPVGPFPGRRQFSIAVDPSTARVVRYLYTGQDTAIIATAYKAVSLSAYA